MHNDRSAKLLYLLSAVEEQHGSALPSRPETLAWLTAKLDAGISLEQVLQCYQDEQKSQSATSNPETSIDAHGH